MRIGEVARAAGVSTSRIRFYEAEGVIEPAERTANGYRDYSPATVDLIAFIERAQTLGFSLKEIRSGSPTASAQPVDCDGLVPALRGKLADVEAHIAASTALRDDIAALIETLEAGRVPSLRAGLALAG
jgi:DNA-binding transcriptional MerR regulator